MTWNFTKFGLLFSKQDLWHIFQIDEFNKALSECEKHQLREFNMNCPNCAIGDEDYHITFLLRNRSRYDTHLSYKRQKVCDCGPVERSSSFSTREYVFECPHKTNLKIELSNSNIVAGKTQLLTFRIKYRYATLDLCYDFAMTHERYVRLNLVIKGIQLERLYLSTYIRGYNFDMGFAYIGLREAQIKAFFLYNNTKCSIPYKLDDLEMTKMCNDEKFPVLKCINTEGFLEPRSAYPILIRFWPIECRSYEVDVPLMLGMKVANFRVQGRGVGWIEKYSLNNIGNDTASLLINGLLGMSRDHVASGPILTGSSTDVMIFVTNLSKTDDVMYMWKPVTIEGLVKIEVSNLEALLRPKESHAIVIKITSISEPCNLTLNLVCQFHNHTLLTMYETRRAEIEEINKRLRNEANVIAEDASVTASTSHPIVEEVTVDILPAEILYISLPVKVHVVGVADKDTCLSVDYQLTQKPFDEIKIDPEQFVREYYDEHKVMDKPIWPQVIDTAAQNRMADDPVKRDEDKVVQTVMETLVADAVFSEVFKETVDRLRLQPSPLYSQIKFDPRVDMLCARKEESVKYLTRPDLSQVCDIFENAVIESIHNAFQLGPCVKSASYFDKK